MFCEVWTPILIGWNTFWLVWDWSWLVWFGLLGLTPQQQTRSYRGGDYDADADDADAGDDVGDDDDDEDDEMSVSLVEVTRAVRP